ncbi:hypothetical protein STAS_07778 [Striga asiatica]|uniref:DUF642 domain-containing protein n=1 Tax=Striga asiatica TaxID=4170 RepID=A0A5A7PGA2_STRAF|nr:hypothetical protein STAS_07778 [Striga asiatica]
MLLVVPEGASAVRLGDNASIKTKLKVKNGIFYSISFSASRTCAQEEKLNVSVAPNPEPKDWGILPIQTVYSSNLLKNGNFEQGPYIFPNTSWGVLIPPNIEDDHSPLPGWMIESLKVVKYIDSDHFRVPNGKRAVELVAGRESAIAQTVKTHPGKIYDLIFLVGDAKNSCEGWMMVEATAGKETEQVPYESKGAGGFKRARLRFKAISRHTRIRFLSEYYHMKSDNSGSLCGPVIDDVRLITVPRHPERTNKTT